VRTCAQCPAIDSGLRSVSQGLDLVSGILGDEARSWDEGILEDLKRQRDVLVGMKEMFERRDRLAGDNVPGLEKRITSNEEKIRSFRERPDAELKVEQIIKLEEQIKNVCLPSVASVLTKDQLIIKQSLNRRVFIRECLMQELSYFHASHVFVGRIYQDWSTDLVKYTELVLEGWKNMKNDVERMPSEIV
jgi:sorting nexin-8